MLRSAPTVRTVPEPSLESPNTHIVAEPQDLAVTPDAGVLAVKVGGRDTVRANNTRAGQRGRNKGKPIIVPRDRLLYRRRRGDTVAGRYRRCLRYYRQR